MEEIVAFNFEMQRNTLERLLEVAQERGMELQALFDSMVDSFLGLQAEADSTQESEDVERRVFPRHKVNIPAVLILHLHGQETRCYTGVISNISLGGLQVSLDGPETQNVGSFEIIFSLPGCETPLGMDCHTCRIATDGKLCLAARFEGDLSEFWEQWAHFAGQVLIQEGQIAP